MFLSVTFTQKKTLFSDFEFKCQKTTEKLNIMSNFELYLIKK